MRNMQYYYYDSPIGRLLLAGQPNVLLMLGFAGSQPHSDWEFTDQPFVNTIKQLTEYFAGKRKQFTIPYVLTGTSFQQQVLQQVANIPYGTTACYSEIAMRVANPKAVRAVGTANATNCLPIIIPCHRVIGKNGTLTGFGGGLPVKQFLLDLEKRTCK